MAKTEVQLKGGLTASVENVSLTEGTEIYKALLLTPASEANALFVGWGETASEALIDALFRRESAYEELRG